MQNRLLRKVDLFAFGILGAVACETYFGRVFGRMTTQEYLETASVIGATIACYFLSFVFADSPSEDMGHQESSSHVLKPLLTAAGAVLGTRARILLISFPDNYPILDPRWRKLSLILFVALWFSLVSSRRLHRLLQSKAPPRLHWPHFERLSGCVLPLVALSIVYHFWGFPTFPLELLAALGATCGLSLARLLGESKTSEGRAVQPTSRERIQGLVVCAGLIVICHHFFTMLPDTSLKGIVMAVALCCLGSISGVVIGAAMTNQLGRSASEALGIRAWFSYAGSRTLLVLFLTNAGAFLGRFLGSMKPIEGKLSAGVLRLIGSFRGLKPVVPTEGIPGLELLAGALLGGIAALVFCLPWRWRKAQPFDRAISEALAVAVSFIKVALPLGLLAGLCTSVFFDRLAGQGPILIGLIYGPIVGGTLGLFYRLQALYRPVPVQEWIAIAWCWLVTLFFVYAHQDALIRMLSLPRIYSAAALVAAGVLLAMAVLELCSGTKTAGKSLPSS